MSTPATRPIARRVLHRAAAFTAVVASALPALSQTATDTSAQPAVAAPADQAAPQSPMTAPSQPQPAPGNPAAPAATTAPPSVAVPGATSTPVEKKCEPCERDDEEASEGVGAFFIGAGLFDRSSLNDRLRANGYEELSSVSTLIGGEGHAIFQSGFVAGARGGAIMNPNGAGPGGMQTHFGGGFGMLDLGFALVHSSPFALTLTAGIGGYGTSLDIGDEQSARFDDVLANPRRSASLSRGGLLTGVTLGFDGRVPVGHVERGRRGFFALGGRIGFLYGPALGGWGLSPEADATAGPSFGLTGGFAALAIGFGGGSVRPPR